MYLELIDHILASTVGNFPELSEEPELKASFTHWLQNKEFFYKIQNERVINFWETEIDNFLRVKNTTEQEVFNEIPFYSNGNEFDFIDLFAGIGGFNLALTSVGGRCVLSSEWDRFAKKTYTKNYGKTPFGDINQFTGENINDHELDVLIPDHNVLAAGFPCQPFSNAGVSARNALGIPHGFECETQGTLFHSIARIAYVKQPEIIFMENVKNIVSHDKGATFNVIKTTMESLSQGNPDKENYRFYYSLINSESLVAQRRVRCYMVCIREDVWKARGELDFDFPDIGGESIPLRRVVENTLPIEAAEYTISDALWEGHINRTQRNLARKTGFTAFEADLDRPSNTIVARYGKDGKECLVPQENNNPRKLTINECRQLFGYPDNFVLPDSKTSAYKQFGNSVVVPVVERIAGNISDYL